MKKINNSSLVNLILPVIAFIAYGFIYDALSIISRFLLFRFESKAVFYLSFSFSIIISLLISYTLLKKYFFEKISPFKKYIIMLSYLLLSFLFLVFIRFLSNDFIVDETMRANSFEGMHTQVIVKKIIEIILFALIGFKLLLGKTAKVDD